MITVALQAEFAKEMGPDSRLCERIVTFPSPHSTPIPRTDFSIVTVCGCYIVTVCGVMLIPILCHLLSPRKAEADVGLIAVRSTETWVLILISRFPDREGGGHSKRSCS